MSALQDEIRQALREVLDERLRPIEQKIADACAARPALPARLSVREAATLARRHPDTVRRAITSGAVHASRPAGAREWTLARVDVERWIAGDGHAPEGALDDDVAAALARIRKAT